MYYTTPASGVQCTIMGSKQSKYQESEVRRGVKITIEGTQKEIADFVLAVQNRQFQKMDCEKFVNLMNDYEANYRKKPTQQT